MGCGLVLRLVLLDVMSITLPGRSSVVRISAAANILSFKVARCRDPYSTPSQLMLVCENLLLVGQHLSLVVRQIVTELTAVVPSDRLYAHRTSSLGNEVFIWRGQRLNGLARVRVGHHHQGVHRGRGAFTRRER